MDRTRVPAHEPPSNGPAPFRTANRLRAPSLHFAGAARRTRTTSGARRAPLRLFPGCLSGCRSPRHATGTPAAQTLLALALGVRSSRAGLFYVHQSFHGSGLVSVHVPLLRGRHSLGPGIDPAAARRSLPHSGLPPARETRPSLDARRLLAPPHHRDLSPSRVPGTYRRVQRPLPLI